jgi:hypothetical protein
MSFLNTTYSATVAARLTQKGRNAISKGNFNVSYFAIGDSEYNYSGITNQNILAPFDKDSHVKYPFWYTSGSTFFGVPVDGSITTVCKNLVEANSGWTLSTVWDKNPIGLINTGTTNAYVGVKNLLGYSSSSGQTYNTGTTIYDTTGTAVTISPEEQKAIAILHYTQSGTTGDPYRFFKYDDYICIDDTMGQSSFNVTLSSIMYHRLTGATSGATFTMGTVDKKMISNYNSRYELPYRDLVDSQSNRVGKIFHNQKIVVFDDEEIVAALDTGSTRNYTLTAPKVDVLVTSNNPITDLTVGKTMWVTYKFGGGTVSDDLPCNYFMKVTGSTNDENVTVKFNSGEFKHLNSGYTATEFHILIQINTGQTPSSGLWYKRDYTTDLGGDINNIKTGHTFTINQTKIAEAIAGGYYSSSLSGFGVDRPLSGGTITGTVALVRASDIEEMVFNLNLPNGTFGDALLNASQNPTYTSGYPYITEVALLNNNKETLVMGKLASPIRRTGAQIVSVKLDF